MATDGKSKADVAVVVVHGIGEQLRGATVHEWSDPILRRLDAISRERGGGGANVERATRGDANGKPAKVTIRVEATPGTWRTVVLSEARWAEEFPPPKVGEVFSWALTFIWRASGRLLTHTGRMIRRGSNFPGFVVPRISEDGPIGTGDTPGTVKSDAVGPEDPLGTAVDSYVSAQLSSASMVVGFGVFGILAIVPLVGVLLGGLLMLLIAFPIPIVVCLLLLIAPVFKWVPMVRQVMITLVTSIGDASVWTTDPIGAAMMRDTVRSAVDLAAEEAHRVVVIAHSQGAAVAAEALFETNEPSNVSCLITVGGANMLLRRPTHARQEGKGIVELWAANHPSVEWINVWSTWDLVPSGPVGATAKDARKRFHACAVATGVLDEAVKPPPASHNDSASGGQWARMSETGRTLQLLMADVPPVLPDQADPDSENEPVSTRRANTHHGLTAVAQPASARQKPASESTPFDSAAALRSAFEQLHTEASAIGPVEIPVENRMSLIADHTSYTLNSSQVVDPVCRLLLGDPLLEVLLRKRPAAQLHRYATAALAMSRAIAVALVAIMTFRLWTTTELFQRLAGFLTTLGDRSNLAWPWSDLWTISRAYMPASIAWVFVVLLTLLLWRIQTMLWQGVERGLSASSAYPRISSIVFFGLIAAEVTACCVLAVMLFGGIREEDVGPSILLLGGVLLGVMMIPTSVNEFAPLPENRKHASERIVVDPEHE